MPLPSGVSLTVLVDTGSARFRVDLKRRQSAYAVLRIISEEVPENQANEEEETEPDYFDLSEDVDKGGWITALLDHRPAPAKDVFVFSVRVGAAVAEVPSFGGGDQSETIAMEIEALTGQSTEESQWTWKRLSAPDGFLKAWGIAAPFSQLIAWREVIGGRRGCRLMGVGHPAGLPTGAEQQIELWEGLAMHVQNARGKKNIRGWSGVGAERVALADPEVQTSLSKYGLLAVTDRNMPEWSDLEGIEWIRLDSADGQQRWAEGLATVMDFQARRPGLIPWLSIPKPEMSTRALVTRTVAVTAAVLVLTIAYHLFLLGRKDSLEEQVASLRTPIDEHRERQEEIRKLNQELRTLRSRPEKAVFNIEAHEDRLQSLLSNLADAAGGNILLRSIKPEGFDVHVSGVATTPQGAAAYAMELDFFGGASGWRASLVEREALLVRPDGGPWTFLIELTPSPVRTPVQPDSGSAKKVIAGGSGQ